MLGRRLLLLVVVLMGITALAASLAPRQPSTPATPASRAPSATEAASAEPAAGGDVVEETLSAAPRGMPPRLRIRVGDVLRLEVAGDVLDAVELRGLDQLDGIAPEAPARFELLAERPGRHQVVLTEAGRQIGEIQIAEAD